MNIEGYSEDFICGVIGFAEEFGIKEIVKLSDDFSKDKYFKSILIRRVSNINWGIEFVFVKNEDIKNLDDLLKKIKSLVGEENVNRWDISENIIQIKPKFLK